MSRSRFVFCLIALLAMTVAGSAWAEVPEELAEEMRPLVEAGLASQDVAVQSWAIRAAALLDDEMMDTVEAGLENLNAPVRIAAATALLRAGESERDALAQLTTEMTDGDAATRTLILERLLPTLDEDDAVTIVDGVLDATTDADIVRTVVGYLARRSDGELYDLLERAPTQPDELRALYIDAVTRAERPEGVAIAAELLDSSDAAIRLEGAEIAFALNTVEARGLLEDLLDSSDAALAQRAGFHLAQYGNASALNLVRDLALNTEMDEALRMDAMAMLRDNGPQLISYEELQTLRDEEGRTPAFRTRVHELMGATQDPAAIEYLREMMNGLFADERLDGISGMGYSGQISAVEEMRATLSSNSEQSLRLRSAEALGNLGDETAVQALAQQLQTERVMEVKVAIIEALASTGSAAAAQPIANEFARQENETAVAGLRALRALGDASIAPQIETVAIAFRDPAVRWEAVVTLTHLDPELGRIRLLQALDRPPEGFRADLEGLPEDLLNEVDERLLTHSDTAVREAALFRVLGRADGGYAVLRPLLDAQGSPDVRRSAISVVTATRNLEDAPLFESLSGEADRALRLQGFAALAELGDPEREEFFHGYTNHADVALRLIAAWAILNLHAD